MKVVVVGAVALGPKAACRLKRLVPDAHVTMVDRDRLISYGGCGIPYFISGDVSDAAQLLSTSFHMVRDETFFRKAKDIHVRTRTEAFAIDRERKIVSVRNLESGEEDVLPYDKLVLATGSIPQRLPVPGSDLEGVFTVANMNDAIAIKDRLSSGAVDRAVIVGAGAIGLEIAEAFADLWGVDTSVVEIQDQILPGVVESNLARMAQRHMEEQEVVFYLNEGVERIERKDGGLRVVTDRRTLDTDIVVTAIGVRPNSELARKAGLELTAGGGIAVNDRMQTSDPDIYAGGDCVEVHHLLLERPVHMPLGSLANRQGRVIGTNLAGGDARFEGVVGSFVIKLFELAVASTGLTLSRAREAGFDAVSAFVVQGDRAHFYPEMDLMYLELVVERNTRRILGLQGLSGRGDALAGRIDAVAALLKYKPVLEDLSNLELAYSPPFSAAMDILNAVANTAENILDGKNRTVDVDEFDRIFRSRSENRSLLLDVRAPQNARSYVERYPSWWVNIPQEELKDRLEEVPRDKSLILVCNSGVRSYEAQVTLDAAGIKNTRNLQGGVAALKKWGVPIEG